MVSNLELQNKIAILLVSHGSSLPFAETTFNEIKDKFNKATGFATEVGYMKVAQPSISGAVENLKKEVPELEKIIAIPVFLAPGIHTNIDIPTLLGLSPLETDPRCPDGNYPDDHYLSIADDVDFNGDIELLPAIGPDDDLLEVINKRINEALADSELNGDAKTGILLVSHGSRLKYNKEFISYINDDMNTSSSLTVLYDVLKDDSLNDATKKALVESFDKVLSLDLLKQEEIKVDDELIKFVEKQIELRLEAKKNKDFLTADKIRDKLLEKGISLKDTKEGTTWSKK